MIIEIKVPGLPESVTEATLMSWNVKVGDYVKRDQNLIDIETDKVVLELPAPDSGVITEIIAQDRETVEAEQLIAKLDTAKKEDSCVNTGKTNPISVSENKQDLTTTEENKKSSAINIIDPKKGSVAMPSAAKIAAEKSIDLDQVSGSGKDGRILKEDVQDVQNKFSEKTSTLSPVPPLVTANRIEKRVPMTRIRQRVAERLLNSQHENAILTTFNEINMKPVMDLRREYKDLFAQEYDVKLGFMSFFVKATIAALKKYPVINASIDGNDIVYHNYFDIGIAVSTPRGLVVPIIRDADLLTFAEIETQIIDFATRAQNGKLSLDEITGGTFSITNGGTFGSMMSTPIINPPQSAILGMHSIYDRAVVENNQVVSRPMMYVALSYDHRLIDGKEAVLTLVTIKQMLEDPARILLEI
ncbi:MAG: 2-oxoglutarate dehydrogenase complex dihydrolipoyllysine-residue succinyltransferase [Neisseriaceae bacterium]|nr:MAG: 2-oxoglutarate dehydrogenase complex dihydrolipoyllysine-residue succinyltransferase [Neisseriaceae bacterium]